MTLKVFNCKIQLSAEDIAYLDECCRKREISFSRLCSRLFTEIVASRLVLSVLDDDDRPDPKLRAVTPKRASPPPKSSATKFNYRATLAPAPSKEALRAEIARAVATNTAAIKI